MKYRDFLDEEFMSWCQQQYDTIKRTQKVQGKPKEEDVPFLKLDKQFERFYRNILMN